MKTISDKVQNVKPVKFIAGSLVVLAIIMWASYLYYDNESLTLNEINTKQLEGQFINLTNGRTYYELSGPEDGEVVVLVHGFSIPSYIWEPTKRSLVNAGYQVLAFDLFGRGYSDRPASDYGMELYVQQLADLLISLNFRAPVNLVGMSMGGAVVTHFTNRYPKKVNKISLLAPLIETPSRKVLTLLKAPLLGDYLAKVMVVPMLDNGLDRVVYDPLVFPDWHLKFTEQTLYEGFARAILKTAHYLDGKTFKSEYEELGQRNIPMQLFWGRQDKTIPYTDSAKVLSALGQIEFIALDKTGHLPHYEHPGVVNARLVAFLNK